MRRYSNLSQEDVANACGVNRAAVALWESEDEIQRTTPTLKNIAIFSKLTKTPLDWLVFEDEQEIKP